MRPPFPSRRFAPSALVAAATIGFFATATLGPAAWVAACIIAPCIVVAGIVAACIILAHRFAAHIPSMATITPSLAAFVRPAPFAFVVAPRRFAPRALVAAPVRGVAVAPAGSRALAATRSAVVAQGRTPTVVVGITTGSFILASRSILAAPTGCRAFIAGGTTVVARLAIRAFVPRLFVAPAS